MKGKISRSCCGRPRMIDNIRIAKLSNFMNYESVENLKMLKREIRLQAKESYKKDSLAGNNLDCMKISVRWIGRYTKLLDNGQLSQNVVTIIPS